MRNVFIICLAIFTACSSTPEPQNPQLKISTDIRVNQLGYLPRTVKRVVVVKTNSENYTLVTEAGKPVFEGRLQDRGIWELSGESVKLADFSDYSIPGSYYLIIDDKGRSSGFRIDKNVYDEVFTAVIKSYYYQRTSLDLEEKYAGKWARPAGHMDQYCKYHPSTGKNNGILSSPKGWYDAGDFNKYIVNAGITTGNLMAAYEMYPDMFPDEQLNIPESGNGISDLLDEVRWELDWALTMQDEDGGVFVKLTSKGFCGFIMPHEDTDERFVVGKSTAASLDFAAMMAQASRVFKDIDAAFASTCAAAAERAWKWSVLNPEVYFTNPEDISTGEYGDADLSQEFLWAAAELYISTGLPEYLDHFNSGMQDLKIDGGGSWAVFLDEMAFFSLVTVGNTRKVEMINRMKSDIIRLADDLLVKQNNNPYRISLEQFNWGSSCDISNFSMVFAYAYELTGERKYYYAVCESLDYLFGKNATGYSMVTGFGYQQVLFPHHRASGADGIPEPVPGFVIGGPNSERQDHISKTEWGVEYPHLEPAKSYVDLEGSWASNEVCINWNAPLVFSLAFLLSNY